MIIFIQNVIEIWKQYGHSFIGGLGITLIITLFSLIFSTILGMLLGYINTIPVNKKKRSYILSIIIKFICNVVVKQNGNTMIQRN